MEIYQKPIWEEHAQMPREKAKREGKKESKKLMRNVKIMRTKSEHGTSGKGFLPSDPNVLCERLELLMASKQAGNTGVRYEIVSIYDELLRQKTLPRDAYKNLMLSLNK